MQCAVMTLADSVIEEEPEELPMAPRQNISTVLQGKVQELISEFSSNVDLDNTNEEQLRAMDRE